jgi:DinB family protein
VIGRTESIIGGKALSVYRPSVDRCDECGFRYETVARADIPNAVRALAPRYEAVLAETEDGMLRGHPIAGTWSALEYCCHVRDVLHVQRDRVLLALAEEQPAFAPMRRDERVVDERYNEQQTADVARDLRAAADTLAETLESLDDDGWERTGLYNWPSKQLRTVEWIGRHTIHEGEHHLQDIHRLVAAGESSC